MITIEKISVAGWEAAIRGMRNPMNSWDKSDSAVNFLTGRIDELGEKDLDLMKRLRKAGTDHRKYMRMIVVYMDITAPLYWWKEFDTYKVGTVANSCSTMHKLHAKELTEEDLSTEFLTARSKEALDPVLRAFNEYRERYIHYDATKEHYSKNELWMQMIQLLPESYNQKRTVMVNYEVLTNVYAARKNHKLPEWRVLCQTVEKLPYSELITGGFEYLDDTSKALYKRMRSPDELITGGFD